METIRAQDSEKFPLYGRITDASLGTVIVSGATFWLWTTPGTAGPGTAVLSGVAVTGHSGTAVGTVNMWYNLAMSGLNGDYVYYFVGTVLGADSISRFESPRGLLEVYKSGA